ncbi:MAG: IPTL-CTERM sorting domain-containing protein [Gammaproteobacteria bacterium]|nr:IPTL-CTERM sorting domain-containing protein [Gammaproteobacteria bacterium]
MSYRTTSVFFLLLILVFPAASMAMDVDPGIDPIDHLPPSWWDFGPQPIDGDFFGPGSDPFDGGIPGDQTSLDPTPDCPGAQGDISMLIERLNLALLPTMGSSDVIDTEIIAMSLVSNGPIVVTYNGGLNPELWNVEITLSPMAPSTGTMTIRLDTPDGGTFDSEFLLQPYFTFIRESDGETRELDGAVLYQNLISVLNVPWVYEDPNLNCFSCSSNFIPGHNGVEKVEYVYNGLYSQHTVQSGCLQTPIPTLSQWGLLAVLTLLLIAGACSIVRRRRTNKV